MSNNDLIQKKRKEYGITEIKIPCTEEETALYKQMEANQQKLPENIVGVYEGTYTNYKYYRKETREYSQEEINELLKYKELDLLSDIRKHTGLFYVLAVLGLIASGLALVVGIINCAGIN